MEILVNVHQQLGVVSDRNMVLRDLSYNMNTTYLLGTIILNLYLADVELLTGVSILLISHPATVTEPG